VVAAASVVASDVPPYEDEDVERLLRAAWWDWPVELVTEHARTIMSGTPAELERIALPRRRA
jgi:virginiamycin A acetyltransferase